MCEAVGAWDAIFLPLIPAGRAAGPGRDLVPNAREVLTCIKAAEEAVEEIGYHATVWCAPFLARFVRSKHIYVAPCSEDVADISPQGELLFCDTLDFRTGDVREGFSRAWEAHLAFRDELLSDRDVRSMQPCSSCPARSFCEGGCLARALLMGGGVRASDPLCPAVADRNEAGRLRRHLP